MSRGSPRGLVRISKDGPLGRRVLTKLKVYAGPNHPHAAQQPQPVSETLIRSAKERA